MNQQELDRLLVQMNETADWLNCGEFAGTSQRLRDFVDELRSVSSETPSRGGIAIFLVRYGRCRRVDDALIETLGMGDAYRIELLLGSDVFNSEELFGHGCHPSLFEVDCKNVAVIGLEVLADSTLSRLCRYVQAWHGISQKTLVVVSEPGDCVDRLSSALSDYGAVRTVYKPRIVERLEDLPYELHHAALRCGSGLERFSVGAVEWLMQQEWPDDIKGIDDVVRNTIVSARDENSIVPKHAINSFNRQKSRLSMASEPSVCSRLWLRARDLQASIDQLTTALMQCPFFTADTAITAVSPLGGHSPELDFFRIVSWGYVTLFERGEPNLRCAENLMDGVHCNPCQLQQVKQRIGRLRTYLQHSLQYSSTHDRETLRAAAAWFSDTIGHPSPTRGHYESCTRAALELIIAAFEDLVQFLNRVNQDEFRDELILRQWRSMRETTWPRHRFDAIIDSALENLGRSDLKLEVVCEQLLGQMQQRLKATKETSDRERVLIAFAERQIAERYPEELPVNGSDLIGLGVPPGPQVGQLLEKIRARFQETKESKETLLEFAKKLIAAPPSPNA